MKLRSIVASIKIAWVLLILAGVVITTFAVTTMTTMKPAGNQASGIELRLSSVDPPDPEPPCIIYRDIVGVPETTYLGLTVRVFNWKDTTLYFSITGSGEGYTFKTVQLGTVDSGKDKYFLLDAFATRPRPAPEELEEGEKIETIELILSAYSDENYTDLVETYTKQVTVHWINSEDPVWTIEVLNNFDDGTVQGWSAVVEVGNSASEEVATDYVLSAPYSLKATIARLTTMAGYSYELRGRIEKSVTTPNKDKVFGIFDLRFSTAFGPRSHGSKVTRFSEIRKDADILIHLGSPAWNVAGSIPSDRWLRMVVPLPKNTTVTLKVILCAYFYISGGPIGGEDQYAYIWLDNFKIISKEA